MLRSVRSTRALPSNRNRLEPWPFDGRRDRREVVDQASSKPLSGGSTCCTYRKIVAAGSTDREMSLRRMTSAPSDFLLDLGKIAEVEVGAH